MRAIGLLVLVVAMGQTLAVELTWVRGFGNTGNDAAHGTASHACAALGTSLRRECGDLEPQDDITFVVVQHASAA